MRDTKLSPEDLEFFMKLEMVLCYHICGAMATQDDVPGVASGFFTMAEREQGRLEEMIQKRRGGQ